MNYVAETQGNAFVIVTDGKKNCLQFVCVPRLTGLSKPHNQGYTEVHPLVGQAGFHLARDIIWEGPNRDQMELIKKHGLHFNVIEKTAQKITATYKKLTKESE